MNILIAPNAFKGSVTAEEAALAIASGIAQSVLAANCQLLPIADGGDGTLHVLAKYLEAEIFSKKVRGPLGESTNASFAINKERKVAIIELAEASGIRLIEKKNLDPRNASTYGTGELIKEAIDIGCNLIYLGIGGSATVDMGMGILQALGLEFHDEKGLSIEPLAGSFMKIIEFNSESIKPSYTKTEIRILTDVENTLLGPQGAIRIFGPQKGIKKDELEYFEGSFLHLTNLIEKFSGKSVRALKGGGASGGVPAGLAAFLNITITDGAEKIFEEAKFDVALRAADIVITGEGKIDHQTKYGKGPGLVAKKASALEIPVYGLCGTIDKDFVLADSHFSAVFSANMEGESLEESMTNTKINLEKAARKLGDRLV